MPGIAVLASAFGEGGATVLVIRLDATATRDYVAAFDGNGMLMWVWPLPAPDGPRTALPGLALTDGWVVAHFDDRLALLPLVSDASHACSRAVAKSHTVSPRHRTIGGRHAACSLLGSHPSPPT